MKAVDLSPFGAMMTGKGELGKAIRQGFGGMLPQAIAKSAYEDEQEGERRRVAEAAAASGMKSRDMKKGGAVVSASKRADGCAIRGKTRGKMV